VLEKGDKSTGVQGTQVLWLHHTGEKLYHQKVVEGTMPGTRVRRLCITCQDNIKAETRLSLVEAVRTTEYQSQWRRIVYDAAKPLTSKRVKVQNRTAPQFWSARLRLVLLCIVFVCPIVMRRSLIEVIHVWVGAAELLPQPSIVAIGLARA